MNKKNKTLSNAIRFLSMDAVQKANSGHPGMPMGMSDVVTILFKYFLKFNPKNPGWLNRDRFCFVCWTWFNAFIFITISNWL